MEYLIGFMILLLVSRWFVVKEQIKSGTCTHCNGEGGSVHPDGLSAEACGYCKGIGDIK